MKSASFLIFKRQLEAQSDRFSGVFSGLFIVGNHVDAKIFNMTVDVCHGAKSENVSSRILRFALILDIFTDGINLRIVFYLLNLVQTYSPISNISNKKNPHKEVFSKTKTFY